jgi:transcriptional regulator with XRE-family HTH domain
MSKSKTPAQILKEARNLKGLTQVEVADKAGIHPNTYAKIERGENMPSPESIKKLLKVLDIEASKIHLLLG